MLKNCCQTLYLFCLHHLCFTSECYRPSFNQQIIKILEFKWYTMYMYYISRNNNFLFQILTNLTKHNFEYA